MQDIQILQEEKLSLQSLSDETTKAENMIKELKGELDKEKSFKVKMRDEYENIVMKMKEKILNRNNELVEQQNNVSKNSELIEHLNLDLRKERELKNEIINKFNKDMEHWNEQKSNLEKDLQDRCAEISELVKNIQERDACIDDMTKLKANLLVRNNELIEMQNNVMQKVELIERQNMELRKEIELKHETIFKCNKDIEILTEQKGNLEKDLQNKCADITEFAKQISQRDACIEEMMKHKKEVLNRNNELVELQINVLQKIQLFEKTNLDLKKEIELKVDTIHKCKKELELFFAQKNSVENDSHGRCAEIKELVKQLHERDTRIEEINDKFFNKNNELVELQNNVLQKSELIEQLNVRLEKEGVLRDEIITKCNKDVELLQTKIVKIEKDLQDKCEEITELTTEINQRDVNIGEIKEKSLNINRELVKLQNNVLQKNDLINQLNLQLEKEKELKNETTNQYDIKIELLQAQKFTIQEELQDAVQEKSPSQSNECRADKKQDDLHPQVDCISSTNISNSDSNKTIRDLGIVLNDKNRTITSLQMDITFLKSLMAESENKVLDLSKDLEASQENCQQLSSQLKKILHLKNEEIVELKNKISKVSAMENRPSQIIKVSAKYQEIIHKRMAEIKSNTVLKELTNFGNAANDDSDLKRSLNSGAITLKDLENFLETTDGHIRRCSEKRFALQKDRDRLVEINRIKESEIISVRKFLTELPVTVKTFNSLKEMYTQKLSQLVSLQRTVRREILNVELTDAAVCKLERDYAATMQDLAKLEAQMDQLESSFQKLLEEAVRAHKGDGAKDSLAMTVQEVRAEYEEKLSQMKTKMKELYQKEVQSFKEAQREEVTMLHQELQSTREKLKNSRKQYEEEIRSLTPELWNVGEKFLDKADEAEWLRKKQRSESLMSLQHVPSDSELRESLRVEAEPQPRKTTAPSRLRSLFSSARSENVEGTLRSRRLRNFFRKK